MLRITLINDSEIVRRGVVAMLSRYPAQVGFAEHADPVDPQVDIALVDTFAPGLGNGPTLARLIADPRIGRTVVYTWNFQPWLARDIIEQGASGYLSKSLTAAQLVAALQQVHGGMTVVSPSTRSNQVVGSDWPGRAEGLTAREAEVLSLITSGLSNADIATRMSLSPNSIKSYVRSGYRKIDVMTRSQAVLWGLSHGMGTAQPGQARAQVGSRCDAHEVGVDPKAADGRMLVPARDMPASRTRATPGARRA
jgi:NarL family two-component system response regulator LiaR